MKKAITVIAALVAVLTVTSGAFAAHHYMITSSSQIKDGSLALPDLSAGARKALQGQKGDNGANGAQGQSGAQGPKGDRGATGSQGPKGDGGAAGQPGHDGAPGQAGKDGKAGFSPTAFGPYASNSLDSGLCGNDWATDKMDRSYVVYPQLDGSFVVAETFTHGSFTTIAGNSPGDSQCGSTAGDIDDDITGTLHGYFLVTIPAQAGDFDPEATCPEKCVTRNFVKTFFGTDTYDTPVFDMHYSSPSHGEWKNASANRGGNAGDIS